jgi:hypothetical protein
MTITQAVFHQHALPNDSSSPSYQRDIERCGKTAPFWWMHNPVDSHAVRLEPATDITFPYRDFEKLKTVKPQYNASKVAVDPGSSDALKVKPGSTGKPTLKLKRKTGQSDPFASDSDADGSDKSRDVGGSNSDNEDGSKETACIAVIKLSDCTCNCV